jgi:hypothetical protein
LRLAQIGAEKNGVEYSFEFAKEEVYFSD